MHFLLRRYYLKPLLTDQAQILNGNIKKLKSSLTARLQRTSLLTNALDSDHNLNENVEPFIHLKDRE